MCLPRVVTEGDRSTEETDTVGRLRQQTRTTSGHHRRTGQPYRPALVRESDRLFAR